MPKVFPLNSVSRNNKFKLGGLYGSVGFISNIILIKFIIQGRIKSLCDIGRVKGKGMVILGAVIEIYSKSPSSVPPDHLLSVCNQEEPSYTIRWQLPNLDQCHMRLDEYNFVMLS